MVRISHKKSKSVKEKIISHTSSLDGMVDQYNKVLTYLLNVCFQEFELDLDLPKNGEVKVLEKLVNQTKDNPHPKYADFNIKFHKFPSYYRRAAMTDAYGNLNI